MEQAPEWPFTLSISNRYGDDEVTNTLQVQSRDALQSWMEALWQLFLDMSKKEPGRTSGSAVGGQAMQREAGSSCMGLVLSSLLLLLSPPRRPVETLL